MVQLMGKRHQQVLVAIYTLLGSGQILIILGIKHRLLIKCSTISAGLFLLAENVCCVLVVRLL